ncbi:hypothetical protein [Streptomyces microflavus]|uniref:hypothetical protein n=1 Tax=Streptomyces microflavus TaxID=1919 RepID=UPI0033C4FF12
MSARVTAYRALHDPELDGNEYVPSVADAVSMARALVAQQATANIYDETAMLRAAVALDIRLRTLLAALEAEGRA